MSDDIIAKLNLQYLLLHKSYKKQLDSPVDKIREEDLRFYKKRIYDVTKRFIKVDDSDKSMHLLLNSDVKVAFDNYAKLCIHYFQLTDLSDIYQETFAQQEELLTEEKENDQEILPMQDNYKQLFFKSENMLDRLVTRKINSSQPAEVMPIQRDINLKVPDLKKKGIKKRSEKKEELK